MTSRLHRIVVPVTDIERSGAFYNGLLGLSELARADDHIEFGLGDVRLMLQREDDPGTGLRVHGAWGVELVLQVPAMESLYEELVQAGSEPIQEPLQRDDGVECGVLDPDGHPIYLIEVRVSQVGGGSS